MDVPGSIDEYLLAGDDYNRFADDHAPANKFSTVIEPPWTWTFIAPTEKNINKNKR